MTKLEKAKMLDEILALFKGNITRNYTELNEQFGDRYHVIENQIKFLIGDGAITEHQGKLTMSAKGFAIYTDLKNLGYVTKELERLNSIKRDNFRFWSIAIITFVTLVITIWQVYISCKQSRPENQKGAQSETKQQLLNQDSTNSKKKI